MASRGESSAPEQRFVHSALIYGSIDEFLALSLPFIERGIELGEPALVAVRAANLEHLRRALGGEPDGVTLLSVEEWYETSARTREKLARWAAERTGPGRVRMLGEPPWAVGNDAQVRDWARHESVINVAFDGMPISVTCAFDARELPEEIVEHARRTHPDIVGPWGTSASESYENPRAFCRHLNTRVERPEGEPSIVLDFNLADLRRVRRTVAGIAVAAGLSGSRADELVLAVNEIASNAVVHGRPPATLRIWRGDGELICEVSDAGDGIKDALAGQLAPPLDGIGGRGIWLTRMLSDAVEIRNGVGCAVTIHAATPEPVLTS